MEAPPGAGCRSHTRSLRPRPAPRTLRSPDRGPALRRRLRLVCTPQARPHSTGRVRRSTWPNRRKGGVALKRGCSSFDVAIHYPVNERRLGPSVANPEQLSLNWVSVDVARARHCNWRATTLELPAAFWKALSRPPSEPGGSIVRLRRRTQLAGISSTTCGKQP